MIAIGKALLLTYDVADRLNQEPDGTFTVSYANGEVLSVQPDGRFERRPAGANGIYERATLVSQGLIYCPDGQHAYLVPYANRVPE
jgi:hypothetical protein